MEGLIILIYLSAIILSILMIVKFFEIAKDVKEITRLMSLQSKKDELQVKSISEFDTNNLSIGSNIVELKTKKQFKLMEVINEHGEIKYVCSSNNGITNEVFSRDEIELFENININPKI